MVAPALVGAVVGPGAHTVSFSYAGFGAYDALFALALVVFALLALAPVVWRRVRPSTGSGQSTRMAGGVDHVEP
jgi:hypothetical protein